MRGRDLANITKAIDQTKIANIVQNRYDAIAGSLFNRGDLNISK